MKSIAVVGNLSFYNTELLFIIQALTVQRLDTSIQWLRVDNSRHWVALSNLLRIQVKIIWGEILSQNRVQMDNYFIVNIYQSDPPVFLFILLKVL